MSAVVVHLIHGFLGLPSDWDPLRAPRPFELRAVDAFRTLSPVHGGSMGDWAGAFNDGVSRQPGRRVLVGYSMGGRLALHALTRNPSLWDAAILISASPGIPPGERAARLDADKAWAERFGSEPWAELMRDWGRLPVFADRPFPRPRREVDFQRAELCAALRHWSVAGQSDLTPRIAELPFPILWIAGAEDAKYARAARLLELRLPGRIEAWIAPHAAHRVPWDAPVAFEQHFWRFLRRVLLKQNLQLD